MYAIVNTATQAIQFYHTFAAASVACAAYNVQPTHRVYIIDFAAAQIEQL
jgi:hypothetical protein